MLEIIKIQLAYLKAMRRDKRAVTAMEYGMIAALISVVIVTVLSTIGTKLKAAFQTIADNLT